MIRLGQESLLNILRLLGIVYPSFSLLRPGETTSISIQVILINSNPVEEDRLRTTTCSPGVFIQQVQCWKCWNSILSVKPKFKSAIKALPWQQVEFWNLFHHRHLHHWAIPSELQLYHLVCRFHSKFQEFQCPRGYHRNLWKKVVL